MIVEDKQPSVAIGTNGAVVSQVDSETCDGIHDEGAPLQYLCTRCFPNGDLVEQEDDDYGDIRRHAEQEIE